MLRHSCAGAQTQRVRRWRGVQTSDTDVSPLVTPARYHRLVVSSDTRGDDTVPMNAMAEAQDREAASPCRVMWPPGGVGDNGNGETKPIATTQCGSCRRYHLSTAPRRRCTASVA